MGFDTIKIPSRARKKKLHFCRAPVYAEMISPPCLSCPAPPFLLPTTRETGQTPSSARKVTCETAGLMRERLCCCRDAPCSTSLWHRERMIRSIATMRLAAPSILSPQASQLWCGCNHLGQDPGPFVPMPKTGKRVHHDGSCEGGERPRWVLAGTYCGKSASRLV